MKKLILSVTTLAVCAATGAYAQTKTTTKAPVKKAGTTAPATNPLKNASDSLSYAMGVNMGSYLKQQGVDHLNYAMLDKALMEVFGGKKTALSDEQAAMTIQQKMQEYMAKKSNVNKEEGLRFLAENKKRPGVIELNDGLQYEVIRRGTGPVPTDTSVVKVNYSGFLLNGKKFDASADHGGPATFPLNRVIKGWTEGLKQMPVGSSYKFYIPSDLAYGDTPSGNGTIPGGSLLIFNVELLAIESGPAAAAPAGGDQ